MRLLNALQSMRLWAMADTVETRIQMKIRAREARCMRVSLLVAERLHGIEPSCASSGIEPRNQAYNQSEQDCASDQPPRNSPEMLWRKRLPFEVDIRTHIDDLTNRPAQRDSHDASQHAHGACLSEEELLYVSIAGADGFHDADFAAAFENRHDQRVDDADGGDHQSETAEDSEESVEHRKELTQAAAGIENREGGESHFLDRVF